MSIPAGSELPPAAQFGEQTGVPVRCSFCQGLALTGASGWCGGRSPLPFSDFLGKRLSLICG